jgi:TPR repeat protein
MYHNGTGVKQDYIEAIKWYSKAAKMSYDPARQALNSLLQTHSTVLIDYLIDKENELRRVNLSRLLSTLKFSISVSIFEITGIAQLICDFS